MTVVEEWRQPAAASRAIPRPHDGRLLTALLLSGWHRAAGEQGKETKAA